MKYGRSIWVATLMLVVASAVAAAGATTAPVSDAEQIAIRPRATATRTAAARPTADSGLGIWRVMGALALVLAAIGILQWVGRRMLAMPGGGAGGGPIRVLTRTTISPRQQLMLVQVGKRVVLAANCGAQINSLCEITDPEEIAGIFAQIREGKAANVARPFVAWFGKAGAEFEGADVTAETGGGEENPANDALAATRDEIGGLLEKVRSLSKVRGKR